MKIGYVTTYDPEDVNNWSGLGFFIGRSLADAGLKVAFLGPLTRPNSLSLVARRAFHRLSPGGNYLWERSTAAGQSYAREIAARLTSIDVDAVLSPGSIPIAQLDVPQPVVFWTDATFAAMRGFYPEYDNLSPISIREAELMEREAIHRASLILYASDWAATSAIEHYGADPDKVRVVPFGANLDPDVAPDEAAEAIDERSSNSCTLLFLGIDWKRKGGDIAVAVARELNREGVPTRLVVVGSTFPVPEDAKSFVTFCGFLDKRDADDSRRLKFLIKRSHFLIHPARAECYGLALCEANAYGVPCVATKVGGITTIVRNGVNGLLLERDADPYEFAEQIRAFVRDPQRYLRLAQTSYNEYRTRLNWKTSGQAVRTLVEQLRPMRS